jgi:hypothetical protein
MAGQFGRSLLAAGLYLLAAIGHAAEPAIPQGAPNCALQAPPAAAGAYVTPGGFLLVYPRSRALPPGYSGCKIFWVVQSPDRLTLLMRLYFSNGELALAEAHDGRGGPTPRATCAVPDHRPECQGLGENPLLALHTPTWPRACMDEPSLPACTGDPE